MNIIADVAILLHSIKSFTLCTQSSISINCLTLCIYFYCFQRILLIQGLLMYACRTIKPLFEGIIMFSLMPIISTRYMYLGWNKMSICIYLHTYVHMYVCMYGDTHIHTYVQTYVCAYAHTYIHTYLHTYIHTYIHIHIYTYIRSHIHKHTYIHIHIQAHT